MVKLTAKKLLALALSILMMTSTVTDWLPTAMAAEEPGAVTQQASAADPTAAPAAGTARAAEEIPPRQLDFQDAENGRPNLYVDFLGDNVGGGDVYDPGRLVAPAAYNKDRRTNNITENSWSGYTADMVNNAGADNIIFWIGVGVDRTQVWELLKDSGNKGLTSLELGFYYNKTYIEPYTGGDYAATITAANIANNSYANQWSDNYRIIHAETDLPVEEGNVLRADPITQDELKDPSLDNIRDNRYSDTDPATDADWRMTYVSLELKDLEDVDRRLAGAYTGYETNADGDPVIPPEASGTDNAPEYLMMIPFVVHKHDVYRRLCLRLIRDASHFSIGAGNDGAGDDAEGSYAAWERVTTRNQGKDLKLQLRFAGDLNIWNVGTARVVDVFHSATLLIKNGGGAQNTARLSVQEDKGATPVFVDQDNKTISNLQGGTGMQLDLTVQSGYTATVWVYYNSTELDDKGDPIQMGWPFVTVTDQEHYTFVMPNEDMYVLVVFQPGNTRDFTLYLSEVPKPYATGYMLGNETTISSFCDQSPLDLTPPVPDLQPVSINSFDPRGSHPNDGHGPGPRMTVTNEQTVTVTISVHPDYEARVHLYNFDTQKNIEDLLSAPNDVEWDPTDNTIFILPFGGTLTFTMPKSDVDVVVEYTKVVTKTAKLEVYHVDAARPAENVKEENIAQLAYLSYNEEAAVSTAYSGQVYEKVDPNGNGNQDERDHSAVHDPSYKTARVPYSAATVSNSLGGDTGRSGRIWSANDATGATALMATLASATSESNLASRFNALDLLGADLLGDGTYLGLRKNLDGEIYGDGELAEAAALLWELRAKVLADTSTGGLQDLYYATGTLDATTTYHYFDLTPAQIQAYHIACLEVEAIFRTNQQEYRKAYQSYQEAKLVYDKVASVPMTAGATAPIPPLEPLGTQVTAATGLREYQGTDYRSVYLADYTAYITQYATYIATLRDAEETPSVITFDYPLKDRPERVPVELPAPGDADTAVRNAITKYKWNDNTVVGGTAEVETAATVSTRSGRTVWLLLEANSAYEVASVELLDAAGVQNLKDPSTGMTLEARASTSFKNVYTFSMPQEDCTIRVNYKLRSQRTLLWQVRGADGEAENVAHIEAYQVTTYTTGDTIPTTDPQWDNVYPDSVTRPTLARRTNEGHVDDANYPDTMEKKDFPVSGLLVKSTVTVRLTCHEDYRVTVAATNGVGGNPIQVTANAAAGIYTFTVPESENPNVVLTVTYAKKSQTEHQAHIRLIHYDSVYSADNRGVWNNGSADITAKSDTALHGEISLAPGYYIYTSYATGDQGSYPYTLDGNAYNNSLGAGLVSQDAKRATVKLETTMPDEDLYVYVVVRRGLPPEEPGNALTVVVLDDDNVGNPLADNWAKAVVYAREDDTQKRVELRAVGKGATGGGVLQVTHYGKVETGDAILAGDRVELDLSAAYAQGYYVAEVGLEPSHLGGDLEWLPAGSITSGDRKLQFTMPAGSTTVTVRFRKLEGTELAPSYYIRAMKTETDRDGNVVNDFTLHPDNKITTATSETIRGYTGTGSYLLDNLSNPEQVPASGTGRGAGVAGEKVTMTFQVAPGWYVQSVAIMTDGSARPADYTITAGDNNGGGGAFTADLVMPAGDAWFIVKYRQCPEDPLNPGEILPRPEIPEHAITLMVIDSDNTSDPPDPNTVSASFTGDAGVIHNSIHAGGNYDSTAIQYIHAGDRVELSHSLAPGYTLDYMIVNPTGLGIVPTYVDPHTSWFTMPARNITVIARIVKKAQQPYTADLILRPPAGMSVSDLDSVGQGTFTNGGGSLTDYYQNAVYSLLLNPGERVDFDLFAFDGYYIRKVTVEPAVGASSSLSGSFGYQSGGFVMPAANVYVNVFFEKLWPDEVKYDLTLKVNDPSAKENNYAHFATFGGTDFPTADQRLVHGGESYTVAQTVLDGQEVQVTLNRETGFYYDRSSIHITDSSGADIPWRLTATGISFRMPPRSTTVEVSFRKDNRTDTENPRRQAILHINGTVKGSEIVRLYRRDGTAAGDFAYRDGQFIDGLRAGDLLHLRIDIPAESRATRRVAAAYAVDEATGEQLMLPITQVPEGGMNHFQIPSLPAGADGTKPIHVYVTLEDKNEGDLEQTMNLVVRGPAGSGTATLFETERTANTVTATAGATGSTPPDAAVGYIHAAQGSQLTVTMSPAAGYTLSQLAVTDSQGNQVSYDWISMLENDDDYPSVWYPNPQQQITLTMPATGGTVEVTYAKTPTDPDAPDPDTPRSYTAQVVVNNEEYIGSDPTENNAWLSVERTVAGDLVRKKLVTAQAGDWVDLDILVRAGYRIMPIFVSPQSFGIKPQLYLGDLDSQTTGFVMPAGDVTVYVRFVRDDLPVYNANLVVEGYRGAVIDPATDLGTNQATIHSDRTGTRGPIDSSDNPVSVQAAANREWVTVVYNWNPNDSWVSSVTVLDRAGRKVPFTQVDEHTITLPMVARDIIVTVTYKNKDVDPPPDPVNPPPDPTPELTPVRLHVIDMSGDGSIDTETEGWGRVIHDGTAATGDGSTNLLQQTAKLTALPITPGQTDAAWGHVETIWVPAGREVTLEAFSGVDDGDGSPIYILSAYVLYRDGGQMIECNLKPNGKYAGAPAGTVGFFGDHTGERAAKFRAHPDYNDVYVFLTKEAPVADEFSATLMLKGPAEDSGSAAVIWTGTDLENDFIQKAPVKVNGDHGRITAKRREKVTVTVTPMEGYAIDYILVTPLGVPITPKRLGNTYTFSMPGYNVGICVYLKRSNEQEFEVKVHYAQQWDPNKDLPGDNNRAAVSWSPDGTTTDRREATRLAPDSSAMTVTENAIVTLDVTLDAPYVVLAAYALEGGSIVPLSPALEGTAENRSMTDNSLADGTATFIMPNGDVDVYVVTTNDPPTGVWHTAVLTVKDPDDSGDSTASITRDNTIDSTADALPPPSSKLVDSAPVNHDFITVREGQTVTIAVKEDPATPYTFDRPALLTHAGAYTGTLRPVSSSPTQYVYEFTVGNCNSAVLANFKKKDAETNPLTVIIEDPDNPGDGTVRQSATVTAGTLDPLTLESVSPLGAYQVIHNVEDGSAITLRAEAHPGYRAYAYWSYGTVRERILLTQTGDVYTGSVTMPAQAAQITVTYYKTYTATITIHDRNQSDQSSQAQMGAEALAETEFPAGTAVYESIGRVTVNQSEVRTASIGNLGTGVRLTTTAAPAEGSVVTAVLATDASGTHFLTPNAAEEYLWWVDKSDVNIVVMIDAKTDDPTKVGYIASVVTRGKPASAADPTLAVTPAPDPDRHGSIWSSANAGATVTVTVPPVAGYRIAVTGRNVTDGSAVPVIPGAGNTYTATMPAANLELTVTYVKEPTLTLRVVEPNSTKTLTPGNDTRVTGTGVNLTADGQTTLATANDTITVTATPSAQTVPVKDAMGLSHDCPVVVKEIVLRTPTGTRTLYVNTTGATGPVTETFVMPDADATVVVRYGLQVDSGIIPDPDTPDDDQDYYTAWVEAQGDDGQPENRVNAIWNVTKPAAYPTGTPDWACGAETNEMKLSVSVKAGYYVTITAETRNPDGSHKAAVPVIQMGSAGLLTASVTMPNEDVFITVTYGKEEDKPDPETTDVTLVLVGHGGLSGNAAVLTGGALAGLSTDGQTGTHLRPGDPTSRVYVTQGTAAVGDELRLSANWADGYKILRATVSLPKTAGQTPDFTDELLPDGGDYTATTLDLSRYGSNATARLKVPGRGVVVTVYYGNLYTATLHIEPHAADTGLDVNGNATSATDDRATTVTSVPGATTIHRDLDRLEELRGGETVSTSAVPGVGQRLVGVVWESASQGASAAGLVGGRYAFEMPAENVDFYAAYEAESDNHSYIAKVRFADGSAHLGDSRNAVTIANRTDAAASHGAYWTAAKAGETVTVNVKVAPGYKAQIIETVKDHAPDASTDYDFYVSRVSFVPNLTLGRDAVFTMPADTDATVLIRFVKGYDLELEVADTSGLATAAAKNAADVTTGETPARTLHGESDGTNITYTPASPKLEAVDGGVNIETAVTAASDGTNTALYKVYRSSPFTGTTRVDLPTPGTPPTPAVQPYSYAMPSADTVETVVFYNEDTPLLAKVEVKGESDINGNAATPILDHTDTSTGINKTTTGTVWTTTSAGNTIDLTLTVAKGYVAKIRVRRDNDKYYNDPTDPTKWDYLDAEDYAFTHLYTNADGPQTVDMTSTRKVTEVQVGYQGGLLPAGAFPEDVSGPQHFRFTMTDAVTDADGVAWTASDVTVLVEFEFAGTIPQPFDPDNPAMDNIDLDRGFIYGENRGDFALIDIPTLYQDSNQELFDTDNYDKPASGGKDAQKNTRYFFFLYDADREEYTPLALGVDVTVEPEDEDVLRNPGDPYNYYDYKTKRANASDILDDNEAANAERTYVGSRFKLIPTEPDKTTGQRTAGAQALYEMLNNQSSLARQADGSLATNGEGKYYTTLAVIAEDAIGQKSAYTQVWIRPHFSIEVSVISYAPNHTTTASVYRLMSQTELDAASGGAPVYETQDARNFKHYRWNGEVKPYLSNYTHYDGEVLGANKYYQRVGVMSSELLGGYNASYDPGAASLLKNVLPGTQAHYALTLEKPSCLTYTRVDLDLLSGVDTTANPVTLPAHYDDATLTYSVSDIVYLITGDVDGNGFTKWQDYDTVYTYVWRGIPWNNTATEAPDPTDPNFAALQAAWLLSTRNPDSMAYRCDLNGDGVLSYLDVNLVQTVFDYNRSVEDYKWTHQTSGDKVLPFGFGGEKNQYAALFALMRTGDVFPVEPDEVWSRLVDPETEDAPPLDPVYVDDEGRLWSEPISWDDGVKPDSRPADPGEKDAVMEVPAGDEVLFYLPALPAEDPSRPKQDDNGPGETDAETPADTTTEE